MAGDDRFIQEFTPLERKRGITMDAVVTKFENRGIEKGIEKGIKKGIEKGIEKGRLLVLFDQVRDGIIDKKLAARYAGMTPQTFGKRMKEAGYKNTGKR